MKNILLVVLTLFFSITLNYGQTSETVPDQYKTSLADLSGLKQNEITYLAADSGTAVDDSTFLFIEKDGKCAMEAEHATVSDNGDRDNSLNTILWYSDTVEVNYAAGGYMTTPNGGNADNATWETGAEIAWEVQITNAGYYHLALRRMAKTGGDDSGFYGVDGVNKNKTEQDFKGVATEFTWLHALNSLGFLSAGKHTIQVRRREAGFIVDRVMIAMKTSDLPVNGSAEIGMPESLPGVAIPPLTFEVAPHTVNERSISMTALDTTDRIVKYYFECVTDNKHDSGWQLSSTYIDENLNAGTLYIYRVKGMDENKYETIYSDTASSVTGGNPPLIFIENDGKCVMEAERGVAIQNGDSIGMSSPFDGPMIWFKDTTESGYAGSGYMTTEDNSAVNGVWETGAEISWIVKISDAGNYYIAIRRNSNNDVNSETAKVGVNGVQKAYSAFWGEVSEFTWVHGPSLGYLAGGEQQIQIRRRHDGLMIDRVMIAKSLDDFPADGSTEVGPAESHDITPIEEEAGFEVLPREYDLKQNYPNPFNPTTTISFTLPKAGNAELSVYNALGQKITTLVNQQLSAGLYRYKFDAAQLASGVYFYKLQTNDFIKIKKMMLIK